MYISAGVPNSVMADMKEARSDRATGIGCMLPPAKRKSFVFVFLRSINAYTAPIAADPSNMSPKST